jgi:hypothetical protein
VEVVPVGVDSVPGGSPPAVEHDSATNAMTEIANIQFKLWTLIGFAPGWLGQPVRWHPSV